MAGLDEVMRDEKECADCKECYIDGGNDWDDDWFARCKDGLLCFCDCHEDEDLIEDC